LLLLLEGELVPRDPSPSTGACNRARFDELRNPRDFDFPYNRPEIPDARVPKGLLDYSARYWLTRHVRCEILTRSETRRAPWKGLSAD
jgi:hypothetical protein